MAYVIAAVREYSAGDEVLGPSHACRIHFANRILVPGARVGAEIRPTRSVASLTPRPSCGRAPPSACAICGAVLTEAIVEHVDRMTLDIALDWPVGAVDDMYRFRLDPGPSPLETRPSVIRLRQQQAAPRLPRCAS